MIKPENLIAMDDNNLSVTAEQLGNEDLPQLVEWLCEKDDKLRYKALLLLQMCSDISDRVYPFWDVFRSKLSHANSYQRSIGLMMIAENTKWDTQNKIDSTIDDYLTLLNDEKPVTVRQCIQALEKIIPYKQHICMKIADRLMGLDIIKIKETMRKLILFDILNILAIIKKYQTNDEIDGYVINALSGEILDKKSKKFIAQKLQTDIQ